jgi:hypothetical protein
MLFLPTDLPMVEQVMTLIAVFTMPLPLLLLLLQYTVLMLLWKEMVSVTTKVSLLEEMETCVTSTVTLLRLLVLLLHFTPVPVHVLLLVLKSQHLLELSNP